MICTKANYLRIIETNYRSKYGLHKNAKFAGATFEEWVGSIESLPKENFGPKVIKQYIAEMYLSIGPTPLTRKEINARFD